MINRIFITEWALSSYLELKHRGIFSKEEYRTVIRPNVKLLYEYPTHPKFKQASFWSTAGASGSFKMKWHNIGSGRNEIRVGVVISDEIAYLCEAYVKTSPNVDRRKLIRLEHYRELIQAGKFTTRGAI